MDDTLCEYFFRQPTQTLHRRYEALRAYFLEHRPLPEVALAFGYAYGTLRNLVADFRAQCQAGSPPPFLPTRPVDVHAAGTPLQRRHGRTRPPSLTAANCA